MDDKYVIGFGIGLMLGAMIMSVVSSIDSDKEQRYNTVIEACEAMQPRHISCEVFAAPVQKVFAPATQVYVAPEQEDRS